MTLLIYTRGGLSLTSLKRVRALTVGSMDVICFNFILGGQFSTPFQGGFGIMTIHGVPKPAWRYNQRAILFVFINLNSLSEHLSCCTVLVTASSPSVAFPITALLVH